MEEIEFERVDSRVISEMWPLSLRFQNMEVMILFIYIGNMEWLQNVLWNDYENVKPQNLINVEKFTNQQNTKESAKVSKWLVVS